MLAMRQDGGAGRRRGVILLVVLAMLTLFAILGLSFVLYAESAANESRLGMQAEHTSYPEVDPEVTFAMFLGQFIYDVPDPDGTAANAWGTYSFLRGHSLARTMYGYNDGGGNDKPYCGPGRLNETGLGAPFAGTNASYLVNFCPFINAATPDSVFRDPERLGTRGSFSGNRGAYVACNVPYTYPDQQNMFLAAMKADGTLLAPSYHRPWLFGSLKDQSNPNWTSGPGKYLSLRPRPQDMGPNFPYPDEDGGDVKNLGGYPGGNDSIWIDIGAPVQVAPDGRRFKVLVAPLVLDLDNRVNLQTAGNKLAITNSQTDHASNQGWGPWDVNPKKVLTVGTGATEWLNMFNGSGSPIRVAGKYGRETPTPVPSGYAVQPGNWPPGYAQIDYNSIVDDVTAAVSQNFLLPGASGTNSFQCFPNFPGSSYNNGLQTGANNEVTNHPIRYNVMRTVPGAGTATPPGTGDDRVFPAGHMAQVLRYGGTNADVLTSDLTRLLPNNLGNIKNQGDLRVRNMVTVSSFDLDRPGVLPYAWQGSGTAGNYTLASGALFPTGGPLNFPPSSSAGTAQGEFDTALRSVLAQLGRLDLNRKLAPFPFTTDTQFGTTRRFNMSDGTVKAQVTQAVQDRQNLAQDIFTRLLQVTGAGVSNDADACRWLAQLAVNIVDYIDSDDVMTRFDYVVPGGPSGTVYGTELPRLLVNEVYVQFDNNKADTDPAGATTGPPHDYNVNVWVELFNPMVNMPGNNQPAFPAADDGVVVLQNDQGPVYQLILNDLANSNLTSSQIRSPSNTMGDPDANGTTQSDGTTMTSGILASTLSAWGATVPVPANQAPAADQQVLPSGTNFTEPNTMGGTRNTGWYCVGPVNDPNNANYPFPNPDLTNPMNPNIPTTFQSTAMTYQVPSTPDPKLPQPMILLRRLANPYLPSDAASNPYVTVDFVQTTQAVQENDEAGNPITVNVTVDDRRWVSTGAPTTPALAVEKRQSWGRRQPYAGLSVGASTQLRPQKPRDTVAAVANQARNTFFAHNSPDGTQGTVGSTSSDNFQVPFDWLVYLDRELISPVELLHVSGFKPHELTQQFVQPDPNAGTAGPQAVLAHQHVARWADPTTRLARLLETVGTRCRANGVAPGGRVPGRVNLNTVWDKQVFEAICDAQVGNMFYSTTGTTDDAVDTIFAALLNQRTPNWNGSPPALSASDRPFLGMGVGYGTASSDELPYNAAATRGVDYTLLAQATGLTTSATWNSPRLLEPSSGGNPTVPNQGNSGTLAPFANHPYQRAELLRKIFNNVTTRSNVFAVWLTVGFFEVTNDAVRPVQLGAEIGRAENRQVRHHMFAIVDRTNLQVWPTTDATGNYTVKATTPVTITSPATSTSGSVTLTAVSGTHPYNGRSWSIQQGSVLTFEPDTDNEETVVVTQANGNNIAATFYKQHPDPNFSDPRLQGQVPVISRGNPGPWTRYDPRKDTAVVPYFAVID